MPLRGLNVLVQIQRENDATDSTIGGRRYTLTTIATNVPARLSAVKPSADLQAQGIQTGKYFNMVCQPADRNIAERDIITPLSGAWANVTFRVTGVQVDSILPSDPRSHVSCGLERMEDARTIQ